MSETLTVEQTTVEEQQIQNVPNAFLDESWSDTPVNVDTTKENQQQSQPTPGVEKLVIPTPPATDKPAETFDKNAWLKETFGWDSEDAGKTEIEVLRKPKDIEFANDESKKVFEYLKDGKEEELYNVLDQKRKVNKLLSAEKVDKDVATQMIKLGMQSKYKDLTPDEIDYKFSKQFSVPAKPVHDEANETEEEYTSKLSEWEQKVKEVEMDMIIEAKLAKPELEKLKTELVLPDIKKGTNQPTEAEQQEELQKMQKVQERINGAIESDFKNFNGYEIKYKDGEVEIPISFTLSDEEKTAFKEELKTFDPNSFIASRWFDKDGIPNVSQMMDDITLLRKKENVFSKLVNEAGAQAKKHYMAVKGNVNVSGASTQTFAPEGEKSAEEQQVKAIWDA